MIDANSIRVKREESLLGGDDLNTPHSEANRRRQRQVSPRQALLETFQNKRPSATTSVVDDDGLSRALSATSLSPLPDDAPVAAHGRNKRVRRNHHGQRPTDGQSVSEGRSRLQRSDTEFRPDIRDESTTCGMGMNTSRGQSSTRLGTAPETNGQEENIVSVKREAEEESEAGGRMELGSVLRQYPNLSQTGEVQVKVENNELVTWPARMPPYISHLPDISLKQGFPETHYKFSRDFLRRWIGGNAHVTHVKIGNARRQDQIYDIEEYDCWSPIWNPHIPPRRGVNGAALAVDGWDGDPIRLFRREYGFLADGSDATEHDLHRPRHTFCKRRPLEYE